MIQADFYPSMGIEPPSNPYGKIECGGFKCTSSEYDLSSIELQGTLIDKQSKFTLLVVQLFPHGINSTFNIWNDVLTIYFSPITDSSVKSKFVLRTLFGGQEYIDGHPYMQVISEGAPDLSSNLGFFLEVGKTETFKVTRITIEKYIGIEVDLGVAS